MLRACVVVFLLGGATLAAAQSAAPAPPPDQKPAAPAAPAPKPVEPPYPRITLGVVSYLQYDAELKGRDAYNAFDVTRTYLNVNAALSPRVRFRVTPDIRRVGDGSLSGSLMFRIKYAFVQFDDLTPRSWVRFGAHQTPWLDFEESIDRYRVQGSMFSEREGVVPGSSDFGLGYLTRLPADRGEINVGVYNGEGYAHAEAGKHKSVQGRVTVRPFAGPGLAHGLRLSAFYDAGWFAGHRPRRHGIVMASYEHPRLVTTWQWMGGTERPAPSPADAHLRGQSVFAEVRQGPLGWAVLGRFDRFTPDHTVADNADRRLIAGLARWSAWSSSRVGLVLTDEQVRYDAARRRPDEHRLLAQVHVQF